MPPRRRCRRDDARLMLFLYAAFFSRHEGLLPLVSSCRLRARASRERDERIDVADALLLMRRRCCTLAFAADIFVIFDFRAPPAAASAAPADAIRAAAAQRCLIDMICRYALHVLRRRLSGAARPCYYTLSPVHYALEEFISLIFLIHFATRRCCRHASSFLPAATLLDITFCFAILLRRRLSSIRWLLSYAPAIRYAFADAARRDIFLVY